MGTKNARIGEYLSDPVRFADMCNGVCFSGETVIAPSDLHEADPVLYHSQSKKGVESRPDHVKSWRVRNVDYALLVAEEQDRTDYHMVLRVILSEALRYRKQWKENQLAHRRRKDLKTPEEFLSGMRREDRFIPVVTLVINLGEEPWDGPRTLYGLLDQNLAADRLRPYINDYKLNIFDYHDYEDFTMFRTELRAVFEFLRFSKDMKKLRETVETNTELYYNISSETYDVISELTDSGKFLPQRTDTGHREKGERINMCKALYDLKEEGRCEGIAQGITQGISQGIFQKLVELTLRKMAKGKSASEIASDLEEEPALIERIVAISQRYAPDYDLSKILSELIGTPAGMAAIRP